MTMNTTNQATSDRDLSIRLTFDQTPEEVFEAIKNVRGWWSKGLDGPSGKTGDVFTYRHGSLHMSKHRVTAAEPGKLVAWDTLDAELPHAKHPREWIGTQVRFEISKQGPNTQLRFVHVGLTPELDCFEACSKGWVFYVGVSLKELITKGQGQPDAACERVV